MPGAAIPFKANVASFFIFLLVVSVLTWLCVISCQALSQLKTSKIRARLRDGKKKIQEIWQGPFGRTPKAIVDSRSGSPDDGIACKSSGNDRTLVNLGKEQLAVDTIAFRRNIALGRGSSQDRQLIS